ncbi:hypothetical protein ACH42_02740 [Endozoicomonas sp. (ex Bugula neritina AB1)]|nr:hypothetical protein ACH42_02740 [Endozoicomonas sp. (ex Bugula neritina AB1)]
MIKPSLLDEVSIFLTRLCALADREHTDDFVSLFECPGATVIPVQDLKVLDSEDSIRTWHQSIFEELEVLKLNVDLLHSACIDSTIHIQACFRCQFCFVAAPDQLEAVSMRTSIVVKRAESGLKIVMMHCSLPNGELKKGIKAEFIDPFSEE